MITLLSMHMAPAVPSTAEHVLTLGLLGRQQGEAQSHAQSQQVTHGGGS